jgi:anti-sigma factor RsiW
MKEDCDDIRPLLDAWIDGELSSSAARRVAHHVEGCPDCLDEAESRRGIDAAISADDKAGDPGDAYFATLGDRIGERFDFAEAARHWAKPEEPPRRRRLAIPRAWVPRFAFGIAGAAVATIAGLLVHDLGRRPTFAPLPRITEGMTESRERQMPVERPASSGPTHSGEPAAKRSAEKSAVQPPTAVQPVPDFAAQPKLSVVGSPTQEKAKGRSQGESDHPTAPQSDAFSVRNRFAEDLSGIGAAARSPAFLAPQADYTARADSAAGARMPGRTELLSFFGALSEGSQERMAFSSTEMLSEASHAVSPASTDIADSTGLRLRRDEARARADSTWIRLRRAEARALADSALAAGTLEDCESALRAYWAMLHRDGRPALPTPAVRAKVLEPDRLRIAALLRCASR